MRAFYIEEFQNVFENSCYRWRVCIPAIRYRGEWSYIKEDAINEGELLVSKMRNAVLYDDGKECVDISKRGIMGWELPSRWRVR